MRAMRQKLFIYHGVMTARLYWFIQRQFLTRVTGYLYLIHKWFMT